MTRPLALITGGAGAFGTAVATTLSAAGWTPVLADIDAARAAEVAATIPDAASVHLDVTSESSARAAIASVQERFGRLDAVINNAGILPVGDTATTTAATFEQAVAINLTGAFLVTQAALPLLQAAGERGRVVMMGSRTWLAGGNPAYTATKAALVGLARSVALDLGPSRGTCNVVAPGPVETPLAPVGNAAFARWADTCLLGRNARPQDVADAVEFFCSERASFITGEVLHVAGGLQLAAAL